MLSGPFTEKNCPLKLSSCIFEMSANCPDARFMTMASSSQLSQRPFATSTNSVAMA
jgi:hypothetical protein